MSMGDWFFVGAMFFAIAAVLQAFLLGYNYGKSERPRLAEDEADILYCEKHKHEKPESLEFVKEQLGITDDDMK